MLIHAARLARVLITAGVALVPTLGLAQAVRIDVTSLADSGPGTLRAAVQAVGQGCGANPGPYTIAIVAAGQIDLQTALPPIFCNGTIVEGVLDANGRPRTFISGKVIKDQISIAADGLLFDPSTSGNEVRNLAIGDFPGVGILMEGQSNKVTSCVVGLLPDGETRAANTFSGIRIGTDGVVDGSIVSGNGGYGIVAKGDRIQITNNRIGLTASDVDMGNGDSGIFIDSFGVDGRLGTVIRGNVVASNQGHGIDASSSAQTRVLGNYVGVTRNGDPRGNGFSGVRGGFATNLVVGGTGAGEANVIAHNKNGGGVAGNTSVVVPEAETIEIRGNEIFSNLADGPGGINRSVIFDAPAPGIAAIKYSGANSVTTTEITWKGTGLATTTLNTVTVDYYANPSTANGFDQGQQFVGSCGTAVTAGAATCVSGALDGLVANPTVTVSQPYTTRSGTFSSTSAFTAALVTPLVSSTSLRLSLGPVAVGARSSAQRVTFTNPAVDTQDTLTITGITSSAGAEFVIVDPSTSTRPCRAGATPTSLITDQSCDVDILFAPQSSGARSATITVTMSNLRSPATAYTFEVAVNGTGSIQALSPTLSWSASQVLTGGAVNLILSIANANAADAAGVQSNAPISIAPFTLGGAGTFSPSCGTGTGFSGTAGANSFGFSGVFIPANGGSCTVTIPMTAPGTAGNYTVALAAGALKGQAIVAVLGSTGATTPALAVGAAPAALKATPTSLTFGATAVGAAAANQTLTVTNTANGPITLGAQPVSIADTANFALVSTTCGGVTLAPLEASSCGVVVGFRPQTAASLTSTLAIDGGTGGSVQVGLAGSGTAQPIGFSWAITPSVVKVGDSATLALTVNNPNAAEFIQSPTPGFSQPLPSGLEATAAASLTGTGCVGAATVSGAVGSQQLAISGLRVPANGGTCVVSVPIRFRLQGAVSVQTAEGAFTGQVLAQVVGNPPATASVSVAPAASIGAQLSAQPSTAVLGGVVRVAITFANANNAPYVASNTFQFLLPPGLAFAAPANVTLSPVPACGGTATAGAASVDVASLQIPTGGGCTVAFDVTSNQVATYALQVPAGALQGAILQAAGVSNTASNAVSLPYTRIQQPVLAVSAASLAFGNVQVGATATQGLTVRNDGGVPLTLGAIAFGGADFRLGTGSTCSVGQTLPAPPDPAAACQVNVAFAPAAVGARAGTLSISSDGGTASIALAGTGDPLPVPNITVSSTRVSFPAQSVGSTSAALTVTVGNDGTAPLVISGVDTSRAGDFAVASACGPSLASGSTCTLSVTFRPLVVGSRVGEVSIVSSDPDSPRTIIAFDGLAVTAEPVATFTPPFLVFPDTLIGQASASRTAALANTGTAPLLIGAITLAGAGFRVTNDCPATLPVGGECTITAVFAPASEGGLLATLRVDSNAPGAPAELLLIGRGNPVPVGRLVAEPASLGFGDQLVTTTSAPQALLIRNVGTAAATVNGIVAAGDYSFGGACGRIDAGATCSLVVLFGPRSEGNRTGSLTVVSDAENSPLAVPLSGRGLALPAPRLSLSVTSVSFGNTLVGSSITRAITLSNTGTADLALGAITASGDFTATSACPPRLSAGATCTVTLAFRPLFAGSRGGAISIASNDPASPARVIASGTGCRFGLNGRGFALFCTP